MKLRSKNPYDHPRIIPNYATHPDDLVPIIEAFKFGEKWAEHLQEYNATIVVNDVPGCQHTEKGWFLKLHILSSTHISFLYTKF